MEANIYNKYKISIADSKFECIEANGKQGEGFIHPDISDDLPKLYIVKRHKEIFYVGITTQDIRKRLRQGFSAQGEHGYYGYKWRDQKMVEILIWCFSGSSSEHVEAIEAELVYFVREKTGNWPKYQMEIHFQRASESEKTIAKSILSMLFETNK